jgi:hypothetical protein
MAVTKTTRYKGYIIKKQVGKGYLITKGGVWIAWYPTIIDCKKIIDKYLKTK